ncbi:hypothetical protein ACR3K2_23830 [Cryptosporidium serpentis]
MDLEFMDPNQSDINHSELKSATNINAMMKEDLPVSMLINITNPPGNPIICLLHIAFKILALFTFLFGPIIFRMLTNDEFIICFFSTIILLSLDFWIVKNVTGRILVGMRWWYEISSTGETIWMFQSIQNNQVPNSITNFDKTVFWTGLYLWPILWLFIFIIELLRFQFEWLTLSITAITLGFSNIIGFLKCLAHNNTSRNDWITKLTFKTLTNNVNSIV